MVASGQGVSDQAVRREQEPGGAEPAAPAVPARARGLRAPRGRQRVLALGTGQGEAARRLHLGTRRRKSTFNTRLACSIPLRIPIYDRRISTFFTLLLCY